MMDEMKNHPAADVKGPAETGASEQLDTPAAGDLTPEPPITDEELCAAMDAAFPLGPLEPYTTERLARASHREYLLLRYAARLRREQAALTRALTRALGAAAQGIAKLDAMVAELETPDCFWVIHPDGEGSAMSDSAREAAVDHLHYTEFDIESLPWDSPLEVTAMRKCAPRYFMPFARNEDDYPEWEAIETDAAGKPLAALAKAEAAPLDPDTATDEIPFVPGAPTLPDAAPIPAAGAMPQRDGEGDLLPLSRPVDPIFTRLPDDVEGPENGGVV